MARTVLTGQGARSAGTQPVYAAANADGHSFYAEPGDELRVKNGNAAACVVTFDIPRTILGNAAPDLAPSIPAGEERRFKLDSELVAMAKRPEGGTDPGMIWVNYSVTATVTVALETK